MSAFRQIIAVSSMGLRNIPRRQTASAVIVGSTAGVVAVLTSVLALGVGFARTLAGTGRTDRAIILSTGAQSEASSSIPSEAVTTIVTAPGIRRTAAGMPIADAELLYQLQVPRKMGSKPVNIALRGVGKSLLTLRPEIHIIKGRMFHPGLHELIVGRAAEAQYGSLEIGSRVRLPGGEWRVVGIFESDEPSSLDSDAMTDAETLMAASHHNWFNSVTVRLDNSASLGELKRALAADVALHVQVRRESAYFASRSRVLNRLLKLVGYFVGGMMAVGAIFSALNTMYGAVRSRAREIATLRAMGFGGGAVVASILVEALLLTMAGALIGAFCAWLFFDGHIASMAANSSQPSTIFAMSVTPGLVLLGIVWACVIGMIGGLFPAVRAARLPVARVLVAVAR